MSKGSRSVSHEARQIREFKKSPALALAYLNACFEGAFEDNEPRLALRALEKVAKAQGFTRLAKKAGLKRESLHRMLSRRGNPEWNSLFRVLRALDMTLTLAAAPAR